MPNSCDLKFTGHIGEPKRGTTGTGKPSIRFGGAFNTGKKGEDKPTIWFNFVGYSAQAEAMSDARKGEAWEITAFPSAWVNKDGQTVVDYVVRSAKRWEGQERKSAPRQEERQPDLSDDDIPFS